MARAWAAITAALVVAACLAAPAAAITFHLAPGTTRCFTEELGTLHRVQLHYKMAKAHAAFVSVSITSPDKVVIFQQKHAERDFTHYFHPITAGDHAVCFNSVEKASRSATDFKVVLSLLPEYEVESQKPHDPTQSATGHNDKNKALMNQARYIEQNLDALHNEYRYLIAREGRMRITNETTNSRTVWVTMLTIGFLAIVRGLHHYTLRRYLKAKKILE
eukprot:CAMPEP_0174830670 /NCGR_PEP_ID=MMETSP1114-20130205/2653_1 /TAXON_ID=312471 /ORGANISM="Neobodo designis, Strain CCAP 1951/1" /LENGTH=218 /DNA_ID=CAMNT_0016064473 /DNA_START=33 /DNA_END=689 /DNA_ORIENTATION=-